MGKVLEKIDDKLILWIKKQKMFFVSTSPLNPEGHVNCSPKGSDSFRIIDGHTVAYLDMVGSGAETIAHLKENGRIVIMFCAFTGPPQISRLHGFGEALFPETEDFSEMIKLFPDKRGVRSIIRINVKRVSTSCGFSVPRYEFKSQRAVLDDWVDKKSDEEIREYQMKNNSVSIDGLPAV